MGESSKKKKYIINLDLENMMFDERLEILGLFNLKKRRLISLQIPKKDCYKDIINCFPVSTVHMKSNGGKSQEGRFSRNINKIFLTIRVVNYWNSLPEKPQNVCHLKFINSGCTNTWIRHFKPVMLSSMPNHAFKGAPGYGQPPGNSLA